MEHIIESYNTYKSDVESNWKKRLTWMGLNGKTPKHTTSIMKFNAETKAFSTLSDVMTATDFYNESNRLADTYVSWVKSKETSYSKKEYEDMHNFFVGAMGEIFFYTLFEDVKCVIAPDGNNEYHQFNIRYVTPTLKEDKDAGVDMICVINDIPSVVQVKFWNPFAKKGMSIDIIQKAYAEGTSKNIINKDEKENVFICFLGNEDSVYRCTKEYKQYSKNVVAFGFKALETTINNRNKIFWNILKNSFANII